jgi:hypothetical protein
MMTQQCRKEGGNRMDDVAIFMTRAEVQWEQQNNRIKQVVAEE